MKKFIVISIVLLMLAGFAITSSAMDVILYTDQVLPIGTLTVKVVGINLEVTYDITDSGWELLETHLYVGTDEPEKSAPGRFPYGPGDATDEQYIRVYTIPLVGPLAVFGLVSGEVDTLYIAAHAEIGMVYEDGTPVLDVPEIGEQIEETAWALAEGGIPIGKGKNWATYFEFTFVVPGID